MIITGYPDPRGIKYNSLLTTANLTLHEMFSSDKAIAGSSLGQSNETSWTWDKAVAEPHP